MTTLITNDLHYDLSHQGHGRIVVNITKTTKETSHVVKTKHISPATIWSVALSLESIASDRVDYHVGGDVHTMRLLVMGYTTDSL